MLTTERMEKIITHLNLGVSFVVETDEEAEFVTKVVPQIQQAREDGYEVRIPPE